MGRLKYRPVSWMYWSLIFGNPAWKSSATGRPCAAVCAVRWRCREQASTLVTSNLPFNEWTEIFGSERLTGALLDRLTHHVHILELNGDSYRLAHSKHARKDAAAPAS